jgi:hypothetical protein
MAGSAKVMLCKLIQDQLAAYRRNRGLVPAD